MVNVLGNEILSKYRKEGRYPVTHVYRGKKAMSIAKRVFDMTDSYCDRHWTRKQQDEAVSFIVAMKRIKYIHYIFKLAIGDSVLGEKL